MAWEVRSPLSDKGIEPEIAAVAKPERPAALTITLEITGETPSDVSVRFELGSDTHRDPAVRARLIEAAITQLRNAAALDIRP